MQDVIAGIPFASFQIYATKYRRGQLESDLAKLSALVPQEGLAVALQPVAARKDAATVEVVQTLFDKLQSFDVDQNGFIDSEEFKMYLQAVGVWNSEPAFTDERWASSFPAVCRMLGAPDSTQGMSLAEFTRYQETYRQGQAEADLATMAEVLRPEG